MAELPPPPNRKGGWYPDPEGSGRLRFWRGKSWSDEFRDAPGGATQSGSGPVPGPPPPASGPKPSGSGAPSPSGSGTGPQPPQRGRWLGAPWWAWLIGAFVVLVVVSAIAGGSDSGDDSSSNDTGNNADRPSVKTAQAAPAQPAQEPTATAEEPDLTQGQEEALEAAQDYIDLSGFSKAGLIQQLSSSAGEGFSRTDATFAANHVDADWNAEAVEAAQDYLDIGGFSRSALIGQLTSSAGEQFTPAEAQYAVNQVYGG